MTTKESISILPFPFDKGLLTLMIVLACLLLVSCSQPSLRNKNVTAASQEKSATAAKVREAEPQLGDTRINGGVEYIYGKNVRYMVNPGEPEYVWVRRDQYSPDASDAPSRRSAMPGKEKKEQISKPAVSDEAGRKWTSYAEDGNGVEYFYDKDTIARPSIDLVRMWRKREFPSGAGQRQIVSLDEIDCRGARYRSVELRVTYRDGTSRAFDKVAPWVKVYIDSAEEYLMGEQCR
jgi:hypothetical protein